MTQLSGVGLCCGGCGSGWVGAGITGAGFNDACVEGDALDDGGDEAGVGDDLSPFSWNWHRFVRAHVLIVSTW